MSRVGNAPIPIPEKVTVTVQQSAVQVKGPQGEMSWSMPTGIKANVADGAVNVTRHDDSQDQRARHGLARNLIRNMVLGVTDGFSKELEIIGVGYRAEVKGKVLALTLGHSHAIQFPIPEGITIKVNKQTELSIQGRDKQLVGETAARIRRLRPPEPYKGKGVKYASEVIVRKAGKSAV